MPFTHGFTHGVGPRFAAHRHGMEQLIPEQWFFARSTESLLLIMVVSIAVLVKGADWLVQGAAGLAYRLGISKVIVGATVVALGTTSPEAAVSVMAAWSGNTGLALGNAVGSIVADTGLIFGVGCLLTALPADRFLLTRQGWVQFGAALLLATLCYFEFARHGALAQLDFWVGVLLLGLLVGYMAISIRWSRQHSSNETMTNSAEPAVAQAVVLEPEAVQQARPISLLLGLMVVGITLVVFASRVLICSVIVLAKQWGVPEVVVAATLVALGTSLPELATGITSLVKGHPELLVGNIIGADILNVLFVIGASAIAAPLPIPAIFLYLHLPAMLIILVLFRLFIAAAIRHSRFSRWMGAPLVFLYVVYLIVQYVISV